MAATMTRLVRYLVALLIRFICLPWTIVKHFLADWTNTRESYASMDHLALNATRPQTEWLNMGDWTNTDSFPVACKQLALRLYTSADLQPGAEAAILDVGHGSGDSLLLLLDQYSPGTLHGVTSLPSHAKRAQERIDLHLQTNANVQRQANVRVWCDDAVAFVQRLANRAQSGDENVQRYDFIFALDCAYHFLPSRKAFIEACQTLLKPGGTLALQDLIAAQPYPTLSQNDVQQHFHVSPSLPLPKLAFKQLPVLQRFKHLFILRLSKTPLINLISADEYLAHLQSIGFENNSILIQDVSHAVFPGFAKFLKQLGKGEESIWRGGSSAQLFGLRAFGNVVHAWAQGGDVGMVRSVTVVVRKKRM